MNTSDLVILRLQLLSVDVPSTRHLSRDERFDGLTVMLGDLNRLAVEDGCIAAAWALDALLAATGTPAAADPPASDAPPTDAKAAA